MKINGNDVLKLKSGEIITVHDVHIKYILATNGKWYEINEIEMEKENEK